MDGKLETKRETVQRAQLRMPQRVAPQSEKADAAPPVQSKVVDSITIVPERRIVTRTVVEEDPPPPKPVAPPAAALTDQTLAEMEAGRRSIAKFQAHNQVILDGRDPPKKNEPVAVDSTRIENFSHTANVTSTTKK